jgi:hypothetical protein
MPIFQPKYKDPRTGKQVKSAVWWYDFVFAGKRIRESAKTSLKTLARIAEKNRRRELEEGFNGIADEGTNGFGQSRNWPRYTLPNTSSATNLSHSPNMLWEM